MPIGAAGPKPPFLNTEQRFLQRTPSHSTLCHHEHRTFPRYRCYMHTCTCCNNMYMDMHMCMHMHMCMCMYNMYMHMCMHMCMCMFMCMHMHMHMHNVYVP